jgi:zinc and cadmium transporter
MQIALSFVAGVMLGVGLLHLLPHSYFYFETESIDATMTWVLAGFLVMFFLQRLLHFHQHESAEEESRAVDDHDHQQVHTHDHSGHSARQHSEPAHLHGPYAWVGAFCGLALHSLIDGVALAAGVEAETHGNDIVVWAGLGTFLAVALHKPFDALTIGTLMSASGLSPALRQGLNVGFGLITPLGAVVFLLAKQHWTGGDHTFLGAALAFAAGTFMCIATSDLLPELHFHSHDRGKLSVALLGGIAVAYVIMFFESSGHEPHSHPTAVEGAMPDHDHDHN